MRLLILTLLLATTSCRVTSAWTGVEYYAEGGFTPNTHASIGFKLPIGISEKVVKTRDKVGKIIKKYDKDKDDDQLEAGTTAN